MAQSSEPSSGVQQLIARIRDEGVQAADAKAGQIVEEARQRAAKMIAQAEQEIEAMRTRAEKEVETQRHASLEAQRLALRDLILRARSQFVANFERHVRRLVSLEMRDQDLIRQLVLTIGGRVRERVEGREVQMFLSEHVAAADEADATEVEERTKHMILGISNEMLREGVELLAASDEHGGIRIRLAGEELEIDITDEAISELLLRQLRPRFRAIIEGEA
jgi:V/A-type H+-transporting ATPase subunit E